MRHVWNLTITSAKMITTYSPQGARVGTLRYKGLGGRTPNSPLIHFKG